MAICLLRTSTILPSSPTQQHHLFLSSLDLHWRTIYYNQRLLFYKACPLGYSTMIQCLKASLSQALVAFFPWAGRLAKGEDGRFVIDCNDAGVEFVEASIDAAMSELEPEFQFKPYFKSLVRFGDLTSSDRTDIPLLSVQVTQFSDGGIALGITQNHMVADGHSLWHFMVSWSECARGIPISKPPLHTRTALALVGGPSLEKARIYFEYKSGLSEATDNPVLAERVFHFSHETLSRLKSLAVEDGSKVFSSFEAFSAHCWKCIIRAYQVAPKQKVYFLVLANCRNRLVPPLPDNYFGNVIVLQSVLAMAEEVLQESLGETAGRLRKVIKRCDNKSVWEMINWLELRDNTFGPLHLETVGMNVASSPKFPVYEVDFGWGKPERVRPARVGAPGEICLFADRDGKGGMDVCLKLKLEVMEVLEKDASFCPPPPSSPPPPPTPAPPVS